MYTHAGTQWTQQQKLTAADGAAGDAYGRSVAVSGDTIVVGATGHQVGNNAGQGAAYVYTPLGTTWSQQQELTSADGLASDRFGASVAISGNTVVVGASFAGADQHGAVYVYAVSGSMWSQQQELTAADGAATDEFGESVAVSGNTLVVGAGNHAVNGNAAQGAAYVYTFAGTTWSLQQELTLPDDGFPAFFGIRVALSGNTMVVGAGAKTVGTNQVQGAAYVYTLSGPWRFNRNSPRLMVWAPLSLAVPSRFAETPP